MEKIRTILQIKAVIIAYLIIIYILPPLAINYNYIPRTPLTNFVTLFVCTVLCVLIMWIEGCCNKKDHFDLIKVENAGIAYTIFTIVGILFLYCMKENHDLKFNENLLYQKKFYGSVVIICILQVLSYGVFLLKKLEKFTTSPLILIVISTLFYTEMHVMFDWYFIKVCLIGGLGFSIMYWKFRNSAYRSISHIILNTTAALFGFFHSFLDSIQ